MYTKIFYHFSRYIFLLKKYNINFVSTLNVDYSNICFHNLDNIVYTITESTIPLIINQLKISRTVITIIAIEFWPHTHFSLFPGNQGIQGYTGMQGEQGRDGKDGKQGRDGEAGPNGRQGETGSTGKSGKRGNTGNRGEIGKTGKSGRDVSDVYVCTIMYVIKII